EPALRQRRHLRREACEMSVDGVPSRTNADERASASAGRECYGANSPVAGGFMKSKPLSVIALVLGLSSFAATALAQPAPQTAAKAEAAKLSDAFVAVAEKVS